MHYLKERVTGICDQLKQQQKAYKQALTGWEVKDGLFFTPAEAEAAPDGFRSFDSLRDHWYGPDRHYWFRTDVTVPPELDGKGVWLILHTQIEEWDDGKNPQFLLFVDGEIVQGLDMNHREVLLLKEGRAGQTLRIDIQAYTGTLHSEFRLIGELVTLDPEIRGLFYDLATPLWGLARMDKEDQNRLTIVELLNNAVNLLDLRNPHDASYYASVKEARRYLAETLYGGRGGWRDVVATCIGHTHIDVAWWWTVAQTREKVARSFATVLKLMDEFPSYRFMSSQPQLYVFLKERYPELYEQVKQRIREGRWEPEGGMWLEADCNLTSGESLVRQFLFGKRFFREEFGVDNKILWLPDVFGYSAALPQIMKLCGIDYFMTTKLSWNQFNKIPHDTFLWRGIDGSEVLTHFITTLGVGQKVENFFTTYNGLLHPDAIMGGWERYQDKGINNDILIAFGYGDGGGGPTREMLEVSDRMEKGVRGIPAVRQTFAGQYFEELDARVRGQRDLATWVGELYFEYHRGTYTSMARNKRANRKSEFLLMDAELLSVLAAEKGLAYPTEELARLWRTVLLNQFHDILPGSSIKEVYEVTKAEYEEIAAAGGALVEKRLRLLSGEGEGVTIFNTLGFVRNDVVRLTGLDAAVTALDDGCGHAVPVQHTEDGAYAYVENLPSKGRHVYAPVTGARGAEEPFRVTAGGIETPFFSVKIDGSGAFVSLFDKENNREVLKPGAKGNLLRVYEDKPIYYDNWDIEIYHMEKYWDLDENVSVTWAETGPVRAVLRTERPFSRSVVRQDVVFYADMRRIDFETTVDWNEHQHLLKAHFPVDIHSDEAAFDIQFGNVTRKTHKNTSWDMARFESCAQKWMDISEGGYGVSLLNDCKYGHSVDDGVIGLTLIKSGIEPNPDTDNETHVFTYSLYPHAGTWREAHTVREAMQLNQPAYAVKGGSPGARESFASVDRESVMLETVKRAEDGNGVILRVYETMNNRETATIRLDGGFASVHQCNLLEEPVENASLEARGDSFTFTIRPYEIKTFRVIR